MLGAMFRSVVPRFNLLSQITTRTLSHAVRTQPTTLAKSMATLIWPSRPSTRAASASSLDVVPAVTRGMKTRSSVKRLCDGCKVRFTATSCEGGQGNHRSIDVEANTNESFCLARAEEGSCIRHLVCPPFSLPKRSGAARLPKMISCL